MMAVVANFPGRAAHRQTVGIATRALTNSGAALLTIRRAHRWSGGADALRPNLAPVPHAAVRRLKLSPHVRLLR
jgi:hypothetical protein